MKVCSDRGNLILGDAVFHPGIIRRRDLDRTERHNPAIAHNPNLLPIERLLQERGKIRAGFGGRHRLHESHTRRKCEQSKPSFYTSNSIQSSLIVRPALLLQSVRVFLVSATLRSQTVHALHF